MPESKFTSGASAWSDEGFLRAFEDLSFPADLFHHREHIHVAWLYLKSSDAWRAAELPSHAYAGLDAPGGRRLGGNTGGMRVRTVPHRPSATAGHEPSRQILFERTPRDCRCPRRLG